MTHDIGNRLQTPLNDPCAHPLSGFGGTGVSTPVNAEDQPIEATIQEMECLRSRNVLITGGTTGIGRITAIRLLRDGANVMIFGRHEAELTDALNDMRQPGFGRALGMIADQSNTEDLQRVFDKFDKEMGRLDILINNAAIGADSADESGLEEIRYVVEANLIGLIQCTRLAMDRFEKNGRGQIVNVGSLSNTAREKGSDVYVATKAAVNGFSESFRKTANKKGVRVVLIEPGLVSSDMSKKDMNAEQLEKKIAANEMLRAEDIAESIRFALMQPERCDIISMQIRPHGQSEI